MFSYLDWILLGLLFVIISFLLWIKFFYIISLSCFLLWILLYLSYFITNPELQFLFFVLISFFLLISKYLLNKNWKKNRKDVEELESFIVKDYNDKKIIYFDFKIIDIESNENLNEWDTVEIVEEINESKFKVKKIM
jgi:membrane protein implicated in regulation of membrane protease activity